MKITVDLLGDQQVLSELAAEIDQFQSAVTAELKRQLVPRTPIDSGRARRGWTERQGKSVENRVPYIERLEQGYSRQAPRGFVNQSIQATVTNVKRIIK